LDPVVDLDPFLASLARDARVLDQLAAALGEPVHPFKDKLIFKPPGASGYGLHQDYIAWPDFPESCTILVIPLDPSTPHCGGLEVYPGLHRHGYLAPEDGEYHVLPEEAVAGHASQEITMQPGDALIFSGLLPHRSGVNQSNHQRRHLYFSYNAQSDGGDLREDHYRAYRDWYAQRNPWSKESYFE
jgi:ectoine hydroxylase-related dioxygenase (phytanoyl-CoA dioxygenase family)